MGNEIESLAGNDGIYEREGGSEGGLRIINNGPGQISVTKPGNSRGWLVFCFR